MFPTSTTTTTTATTTTVTTNTAVPLPNGATGANGLLLYMVVAVANDGFDAVDEHDKPTFRRALKSDCEAMLGVKYVLAETVSCRVTDYSSISYRRARRSTSYPEPDTVNVTMRALFKSTNAATDAFARTNSQVGRGDLQNKTVRAYNTALARVGRSLASLSNATADNATTHTVELRGVPEQKREDWTWLYVVCGLSLFTLIVLTLAWIKYKNDEHHARVHEEMLQMQDPDGWFKHRFSEATIDGRRSSAVVKPGSVTPFEVVRRGNSAQSEDPFLLPEEGNGGDGSDGVESGNGGSGKTSKPVQAKARKSLIPPRLSKNRVAPMEVIRGPAGVDNSERSAKPPQRKVRISVSCTSCRTRGELAARNT